MEDSDTGPRLLEMLLLASSVFKGFSVEALAGILTIIILLFFSSMISGSEIAYFSMGPGHLNDVRQRKGSLPALILQLLDKPKRLLATILIANNFVNVGIVIISTFVTGMMFDFHAFPIWGFFVQVIAITALILLFGEIMPKIYAASRPVQLAFLMAGPLKFMIQLFYPLSSLLIRSTSIIDRKIGRKGLNITMSELSDAIDITSGSKEHDEDRKLLKGIVKFQDIEVKEIMKSRVDVFAIDAGTDFDELLNMIMEAGYSRIPVYDEGFDSITGILYIKDLLPHLGKASGFSWQHLVRPAFFIPENKQINDLLAEFQEKKIHMAIIVDEYGGTSGIITLEDIIEEIVGDISDEFDVEEEEVLFSRIDDRTYLFEGKTPLKDFCRVWGIEDNIFEDTKGESDTVAGLILEAVGEIPTKNTVINIEPFRFKILNVDKRRISRVKAELINDAGDDEEEKD